MKDWDLIMIQFCRIKLGFKMKIMSLKRNSWHISHSLKIDASALEMCCSDTISIGIVWEKCVWRQRASFRPVTASLFSQVVVPLTAWNTSLLSLSLFAKGLTEATRWTSVVKKRGFLRRTPPGFKLLTHAFMWRKYSLQKSVVARWQKHAQQANGPEEGFWNEGISLPNEVTVRTGSRCIDSCWWCLSDSVSAKNVTCGTFTHFNLSRQNWRLK